VDDGLEKKLPAIFYRTKGGGEPARDWLKELSTADRYIIGGDIAKAEFGWPIGMPTCRSLGGGLWEVRSNLPHGRIARVIFCVSGGHMVLLHGFEKKTQTTPQNVLELVRKRQQEIEHDQ
jgi:phage-related protein